MAAFSRLLSWLLSPVSLLRSRSFLMKFKWAPVCLEFNNFSSARFFSRWIPFEWIRCNCCEWGVFPEESSVVELLRKIVKKQHVAPKASTVKILCMYFMLQDVHPRLPELHAQFSFWSITSCLNRNIESLFSWLLSHWLTGHSHRGGIDGITGRFESMHCCLYGSVHNSSTKCNSFVNLSGNQFRGGGVLGELICVKTWIRFRCEQVFRSHDQRLLCESSACCQVWMAVLPLFRPYAQQGQNVSLWRSYMYTGESVCHHELRLFSSGSRGAPLAPKISSKSYSFQAILTEKPLLWANFGLRAPPLLWCQNSAGSPLTKILDLLLLLHNCFCCFCAYFTSTV